MAERHELRRKQQEADKRTLDKIIRLATRVQGFAERKESPVLEVPIRSANNVRYNRPKRRIEMGDDKSNREMFNLSQAKAFMQTLLVCSGCKQLIEQEKTTSIRGLYYLLKHTIDRTKEETFDSQSDCDPIIEDVELMAEVLREELHVYASNRGSMAGDVTLIDSGDRIDCSKMGSGGYTIPSIVEEGTIDIRKVNADFVLHVEKDTVWRRFNEDRFWQKNKCIITHGQGQPPRGVRRLLSRLNSEFNLPIYCLLDNDPWGYYIYSVIKQGSINLAHESARMAVPAAKYIGLRSEDFIRCDLSRSVCIGLSNTDIKRIEQIRKYPWFAHHAGWQRELNFMLRNGFKLEVESLISKDVSYVTEHYVPTRLESREFLD